MRVKKEHYPIIIVATLILFVGLGLLLGFVPQHGSGGGHGAVVPEMMALLGVV
ncbi:MAG: hypothetical protein RRC07_06460 [Anaerolineae bacterium]|nr:hypothetical protein [Anaerolineae bacterium]